MKKALLVAFAMIATLSAQAATYNCFSQDHWDPTIPSVLSINKTKNLVSITGTLWCSDFSAELDLNYQPRSLKNFSRFNATDCQADGYTYILVDSSILGGNKLGKIKVQSRGEMFVNNEYDCTKTK